MISLEFLGRRDRQLLDGTKAYLHAVIDNYSLKVLAWTVAERLNPMNTFRQGATIPDELALKRREAQRLRVERNRNIACAECPRGGTAVGEDVAA